MDDDQLPAIEVEAPQSPATEPARLTFSVATRNAFFGRVTDQLRRKLSPEHSDFTARPMFNLIKVAFENERVHYEIAIDVHRALLEIALHFEDGPVSTLSYLSYFDRHIVELKHAMGLDIELERWTVSWARIYELWPLQLLDRAMADRAGARLAVYISTLQPLVEAAAIPPERSAQPAGQRRERWRQSAVRR